MAVLTCEIAVTTVAIFFDRLFCVDARRHGTGAVLNYLEIEISRILCCVSATYFTVSLIPHL